MIVLRDASKSDENIYNTWRNNAGLKEFLSRLEPKGCNTWDYDRSRICWFIIENESEDAGAVWLEKNDEAAQEATLGIFISGEKQRGKGIGKEAIEEAIEISGQRMKFEKVVLNVRKSNTRAIQCYKRCGFVITGEGQKTNPEGMTIGFFTMKKEIMGGKGSGNHATGI